MCTYLPWKKEMWKHLCCPKNDMDCLLRFFTDDRVTDPTPLLLPHCVECERLECWIQCSHVGCDRTICIGCEMTYTLQVVHPLSVHKTKKAVDFTVSSSSSSTGPSNGPVIQVSSSPPTPPTPPCLTRWKDGMLKHPDDDEIPVVGSAPLTPFIRYQAMTRH